MPPASPRHQRSACQYAPRLVPTYLSSDIDEFEFDSLDIEQTLDNARGAVSCSQTVLRFRYVMRCANAFDIFEQIRRRINQLELGTPCEGLLNGRFVQPKLLDVSDYVIGPETVFVPVDRPQETGGLLTRLCERSHDHSRRHRGSANTYRQLIPMPILCRQEGFIRGSGRG
jgi:hypothetical protein